MANLPQLSPEVIQAYQNEIGKSSSSSTIKRKSISLNKFFDWAEKNGKLDKNPMSPAEQPASAVTVISPKQKSDVGYKTWTTIGITACIIVLIFLLTKQLSFPIPFISTPAKENVPSSQITNIIENKNQPQQVASPSSIPANSAVIGSWNLYAKLKLTSTSGVPQVGSQTLTFKLYNSDQGGTPLYTSNPQTITTDTNGSALIALSNVPTDLFFQNNKLYLEPTLGSASSSANIRIPVSTASTPSNLNGYLAANPDSGAGAETVPVINSDGTLLLASQAPAIVAKQGNFLLQGQAVTIKTADGSDGNIEINPDGNGYAHFLFEGSSGNFLNAQAPNLTSGSLYYGMVPNNATGYNLINLQSGSTLTTKFNVDSIGNTFIKGNENVVGNIATNGTDRLTSGGALKNITGYSQTSGNFTVNQKPGDFASIIKNGTALSDVLTLTLDERPKPQNSNTTYSTLVLNRYDGAAEAMALLVGSGNAQFNGLLRLGQYSQAPTLTGVPGKQAGNIFYNTTDNKVYYWNGSAWTVFATGTNFFSGSFADLTGGTNTGAAMVIGTGASLNFGGTGTINSSSFGGRSYNSGTSGQLLISGGAGVPTWNNITSALTAGTDISITGTTNATINDTSTLNTVTNRGATTTNAISVGNLTSTGTTTFGGITYTWPASQTSNFVLQTNGTGTLSWVDPAAAAAASIYWTQAQGALFPKNNSVDVLIGSNATSSAKFAFTGVNSGTPTASVAGTTANVATYLTGNGNLATTNMAPLTIGGTTTGSVQLNPKGSTGLFVDGTGNVGIGTTSPTAKLQIQGGSPDTLIRNTTDSGSSPAYSNLYFYGLNGSTQDTLATTIFAGKASGAAGLMGSGFGVSFQGTNIISFTENNSTRFITASISPSTTAGISLQVKGGSAQTANLQEWQNSSGNVLAKVDVLGNISTTGYATMSGSLAVGNVNAVSGPGNISASGTIAGVTLTQNGNNVCDVSGNCTGSSIVKWRENLGTLSPYSSTLDVLIGSNATNSAKFAFTGVNSGTPTASIAGTTANVATYLTGNGNLATTNMAPLTIGGATTGSVQLNPKGSTGLFVNGSGNVGIGTTSPDSPLVVSRQAAGVDGIAAKFLSSTGTAGLSIYTGNAILLSQIAGSGQFGLQAQDRFTFDTAGTEKVRITNSGNVGIGNATPTEKLDVAGNATVSGNLTFTGATSTIANRLMQPLTLGDSQTGAVRFFNANNYIDGSGNLKVAGTTTFNGLTYTWPSSITANNYVLQTQTNGTLAWVDPSAAIASSIYWTQAQGALFPKNNSVDVLIGSNATASAKFAFTGVASGTPTASISGATNIATFIDGNGNISTTNRNNLILGNSATYNSTGNILLNPNGTGLVGIGTTTPTVGGLQVSSGNSFTNLPPYGTAAIGKINSTTGWNGSGFLFTNTTAGSNAFSMVYNNDIAYFGSLNSSVNTIWAQLNSTGLAVGGSGNVNKLDINGAAAFGSYAGTLAPTNGIIVSGNVGIGTTSPTAKLDVNGNVNISGYATASGSLALGNTSAAIGPGNLNMSGNLVAGGTVTGTTIFQGGNQVCDVTGNCTGSSVVKWRENLGTLSPYTSTLDVLIGSNATSSAKFAFTGVASGTPTASIAGTTANVATYLTGNGNLATTNMAPLTIGGTTTGSVQLNPKGSTGLFVDGTGNVGIGTTAPAALLSVGAGSVANGSAPVQINAASAQTAYYGVNKGGSLGGLFGFANNADGGGGVTTAMIIRTITNDPIDFIVNNGTKAVRIDNVGNVGIGNTSPTEKLDVAGNATVSGNLTFTGATSTIANRLMQPLTLGDSQTGAVRFFNANNYIDGSGNLKVAGTTTFNGLTYTWPGSQTNNFVLQTNGTGTLSWVDPAGAVASTIPWYQGAGVLYPKNNSTDVLIGSNATSSAKFAFTGVNSGTPTASISGATNIATFIDGNGNISSTNRNNLVLGNSATYNSTGNILLNPNGTGNVGIGGVPTSRKLEIFGSSNTALMRLVGNSTVITEMGSLDIQGAGYVGTFSNHNFSIQANNTGIALFSTNGGMALGTSASYGNSFTTVPPVNGMIVQGNIGIGNTSPTEKLDVAGNATVSGNLTFTGATSTIANRLMQPLTLGDVQTGNINFFNTNNYISSGGNLKVAGTTTFGGITYTWPASQTSNFVLQTNGTGTLSWVDPAAAAAASIYWTQAQGALFPKNNSIDVLIGSTATNSAKFAFTNVATGTPTATIAGTVANVATYLTGNGNLATTNMSDLTLGGASTGNVILNSRGAASLTANGANLITTGTFTLPNSNILTGVVGYIQNSAGYAVGGGTTFHFDSTGNLVANDVAANSGNLTTTAATGNLFNANATTVNIGGAATTLNLQGAANGTLNIGNATGTTAVNITTGTGPQTNTSSVSTGTNTTGAFVFKDTALSSGDMIYATASAITSGNILKLGQGGNTNFTGNVIYGDIDNTGQGGIGFTGNFLRFDNAGATKFTLNSAGTVTLAGNILPNATNTNTIGSSSSLQFQNIYSNIFTQNGNLVCDASGANCPSGSGIWAQTLGAVYPVNNTLDLLIGASAGATATQSAKFAFTGVTGGLPTASIAGNIANVATYLTGNGNLATTNMRDLTLGGSTTGQVIINSRGTATITANGSATTVAGDLNSSAATAALFNTTTTNLSIGGAATTLNLQGASGLTANIGNANGATALNLTSGTGSQTFTSSNATGTNTASAFVFNEAATTTGDVIYATTSAITTGNIVKLGQGGNSAFSGNGLFMDFDQTGGGGGTFTGNFLKFNNAGATKFTVDSVGNVVAAGNVAVNGGSLTTTQTTANLFNATATTVNIAGAGTTVAIGAGTGTTTVNNNLSVNGGTLTTNQTIFNLVNTTATTLNLGGAATTFNVGPTGASGSIAFSGGSADTGCTLDGTTGNFTCSGNITTTATSGTQGWWQLTNKILSPANSTYDLAVGGNATGAAFQVFGVPAATADIAKVNSTVITTGNLLEATASGITSGNILKLGQGGDTPFTGSAILADLGNTGAGGSGFTGNFLTFKNNTATKLTVNSTGTLTLAGNILPNVTDTSNIGSSAALEFNNIYGKALFQSGNAVCDASGANCPSGSGLWGQSLGALYPTNNTVDVLFGATAGSTATQSAKFAFTGINGGLPTASIAGNIANVATYLTGNGNLATTNMRDLTLGGSTTGQVILNSRGTNTLIANGSLTTVVGDLQSSAATANLFTTATTNLTIGSAATTLNLQGASGLTANIGNANGATALNFTSGTGSQTFTSSNATGTNTTGSFVYNDAALTSGDLIYATTSAITTGNIAKLGQGGNSAFSGNGLFMDFDQTGGGGGTFTGNFLKFNNAGATKFTVDSSGNIVTAGNVAINGGNITSTATAFNFDIGNTGTLSFRDGTNTLVQISDQGTTGRLAVSDALQVGTLTTPTAYTRFVTSSATITDHGFTTAQDVLIGGNLELNGILYLDGKTIANSLGTATILFPTDPTAINSTNILTNGTWLVQNATNNGIAALMVDQRKGGDVFSASISGVPKFTIDPSGNVGIGTTTPTAKLNVSANSKTLPTGGLTDIIGQFGNADGTGSRVVIDSFGSNPNLTLRKANGTNTTPSAILSADPLGTLAYFGYGQTAYSTGARASIISWAGENWSDTAQGASLAFNTTANTTTATAERMRIDPAGNVGIGTTSPSAKLHVNGSVSYTPATYSGAAGNAAWTTGQTAAVSASILASNAIVGTGIYSASDNRLKNNVLGLDIPSVDKFIELSKPVSFNWKSDGTADSGFIAQDLINEGFGYLVSGVPDFNMQEEIDPATGFISPAGMHFTVRYESVVPLLTMALKQQQIKIATISANIANLNLPNINNLNFIQNSGVFSLQNTAGQVITQIAALGQLIAANIKAGAIQSQEIATTSFTAFQGTVDNLLVTTKLVTPIAQVKLISPLADQTDINLQLGSTATPEGQLVIKNASGSAVASISSQGDATFSGTVYATNIKSANLDQIQATLAQVQSDQNLLKQAGSWNTNTATNSALLNQIAVSTLYVTGQAAMNSVSVAQTATIGTDLVLGSTPNSINTLSAPLEIQSLALAPVNIMAGLVNIDTRGNVAIAGNLNVAGRIKSSGLTLKDNAALDAQVPATASASLLSLQDNGGNVVSTVNASGAANFSSIAASQFVVAAGIDATNSAIVNGVITTNATAGSGTIASGSAEIRIKNPKVTDYTLVYVTPTSSTLNNVLYVKSKMNGEFVVGFTTPIPVDAKFNWWIVQIQ